MLGTNLLYSMISAVLINIVMSVNKMAKGEKFDIWKLIRTLLVGAGVGGAAGYSGIDIGPENYGTALAANAGVVTFVDQIIILIQKILKGNIGGGAAMLLISSSLITGCAFTTGPHSTLQEKQDAMLFDQLAARQITMEVLAKSPNLSKLFHEVSSGVIDLGEDHDISIDELSNFVRKNYNWKDLTPVEKGRVDLLITSIQLLLRNRVDVDLPENTTISIVNIFTGIRDASAIYLN